jgi:hypothetical protein
MTADELGARRAAMDGLGHLLAAAMAEPDPVEEWLVEEPSAIVGMPAEIYHADPYVGGSLSHSGAGKLLPPSTPAQFQHDRIHRTPFHKPEFDFGHAAHWLVLEGEAGLRERMVDVYDFPDWKTRAAQDKRKESRAAGRAPVLTEEWERIKGMAAAIREHPLASRLFDPDHGEPEVSLFWVDESSGVTLRCRLDWLPSEPIGGRLILADYKTTACAYPPVWRKSAADYGYHRQDPWYLDGVLALGLHPDPTFVFVVQETRPPFLVSVIGLNNDAVSTGINENRAAIDLYAACEASGEWSGYSEEIEYVGLPPYYYPRIPNPTIGEL